ncbi:hypothetical protein D3C84_1045730 [compost metagenome]
MQQVGEDLLQPVGIDLYPIRQGRIPLQLDLQPLLARGGHVAAHHGAQHLGQAHRPRIQVQLTSLHLGVVEDVVDQIEQVVG